MKTLQTLLPLCLLLFSIWGCNPYKFREEYVGSYDFTTIRTLPDSLDHDSSTTAYLGKVDLYSKDQMLIKFLSTDSIAPTIDEEGNLAVDGFVINGGSFVGQFLDVNHVQFSAEFRSFTGEGVRYDVAGARR